MSKSVNQYLRRSYQGPNTPWASRARRTTTTAQKLTDKNAALALTLVLRRLTR